MGLELNAQEFEQIKSSYLNIFSFFVKAKGVHKKKLDCIFNWGNDLDIPLDELKYIFNHPDSVLFEQPANKIDAIEQVYDLVYMIYLDGILEDIELEIAMEYAHVLGFKPGIVGELLSAIDTAPGDGVPKEQVRKELQAILEQIS